MTPKAPQPRPPPVRRMLLRKCAKPEFRLEFFHPDQSGFQRKHFSTYQLSTSWMTETPPPSTRPQKTSMPIKATPVANRSHSGKKLDISKIKGAHLLFKMQDRQEKAQARESEAKDQATTCHWVAGGEHGSGGELPPGLPAKLPKLSNGDGTLTKPMNPAQRPPARVRNVPLMLTMRS